MVSTMRMGRAGSSARRTASKARYLAVRAFVAIGGLILSSVVVLSSASPAVAETGLQPQAGQRPFDTYKSFPIGGGGLVKVNVTNGNLLYTHTDTSIAGTGLPLAVSHVYNSAYQNGGSATDFGNSPWRFGFGMDSRVDDLTELNASVRLLDGAMVSFTRATTTSEWESPAGYKALAFSFNSASGGYEVLDRSSNTKMSFYRTSSGVYRLNRIDEKNGNFVWLDYANGIFPSHIIDTRSRYLTINRDPSSNRVSSVNPDASRSSRCVGV